ncbi:tetratricopeptide repeat protein [Pedobacter frigoris]|uniref:tetratricopeptide repeat protein n=1 Tax=Pedobacter frigoris TaxID=2571272 RepID=UPI00292CE061|nr:tetratricopeptide repeat protein [Pedobacter frigoris]
MNKTVSNCISLVLSICFLWIILPGICYARNIDKSTIDSLIEKNPNAAFVKIKQALNRALKQNDQKAAAICYEYLAGLFYHQAAYPQAVAYYYKADRIFRRTNDQQNLARNLNNTGEAYYYSKQYNISLIKFQEALSLYKQLSDQKGIADSYGLIGQTYEKSGKYTDAMKYQQLALSKYKTLKDQSGIAKIYENLGSIYEDRPLMDSALFYYTRALELNKLNRNDLAQIEIINNIGDVYRKTGRYQQALVYTKRAEQMSLSMNDLYQLSSAYRDLSKNYDLMKRYDSAYHYSELGRGISLKIYTEDNNKQLALLQTLFEVQQKDDAISQFENEKKANQLIIIAGVLITALLVSLAASIISRQRLKLRNEQKLNEQNKELHEIQKYNIEAELELKSKELTSNTLHVIQSNQFLDELKTELSDMIRDDKRDQKKRLQQIVSKINQSINHDRHWTEFSAMFEQIHQTFFDNLKKHSDDLTANDFRLVALIKMNLSSKDMALLFGISQDSLRVSRYRLRKKLNIPQGENLSTFIQTL